MPSAGDRPVCPARCSTPRRALAALLAAWGVATVGCGGDDGGAGNHPPVLATVHNQLYEVGVAHGPLIVTATDPDGDDQLRYTLQGTLWAGSDRAQAFSWHTSADVLPAAMNFSSDAVHGVLSWEPLASQVGVHELIFSVTDGHATDREQVTIEVRASDEGGGAPLFVTPSSYVLQLVQSDTLTAAIGVKDDDSGRVTLTVQGQPEGLTFKVLSDDGKRGEFSWRPTQQQIDARSIYSFTALATDDSGNRSEQPIRVVLRLKDGGGPQDNCPGELPTIQHTPLRDQFGHQDLALAATVADDRALGRVFAAFTTGDPNDIKNYQGVELLADGPLTPGVAAVFSGALPNQLAAGAEQVTYYYYVCAVDDDDAQGDTCDHYWCVPEETVFTFVVHASGSGPGQCADDAREPNSTPEEATPLAAAGTLPDLFLCRDDADYFSVQAEAGTRLLASILFATAEGDLALELLDASGSALARSATDSDLEELDFTVPATGSYLLAVRGEFGEGAEGNGYSLTLELQGGGACTVDAGEPNEAPDQATRLDPGSSGPWSVCAGGDRDVYRLEAEAGELVTARVRFSVARGDLDARLVDAAGTVLRNGAGSGDDELLSVRAPGGELFLEVWGYQGAANDYALELVVGQGQECRDASLEPNDSPPFATPLAPGEPRLGEICAGGTEEDVDLYQLELPASTGLQLGLTFSQAEGDLDLVLFDGERRLLGASQSTDDDEALEFPGLPEGGTVYVQVYGYEQAGNRYSLQAQLRPFAERCLPDLAEPNDGAADAAVITLEGDLLSQPGLSSCGDEDWYAVDLPEGATVSVGLAFDSTVAGGLGLELYQGATRLEADQGLNGTSTVGAADLRQGRYLIRVTPGGHDALLYLLELALF